MKKAVHFGAGNIGRGFIGLLLSQAGYHVSFVDVAAPLVDDINNLGKYNVQIFGEAEKTRLTAMKTSTPCLTRLLRRILSRRLSVRTF